MVPNVQPRSYYAVTGHASTGQTFDRLPLQELESDHPYQWTLFILGWAWIKGEPIPFPGVVQPPLHTPISFMEIGGIHGKPYREWPGDIRVPPESKIDFSYLDPKDTNPSPPRFGGYCHHAAITFLSWHRPYMMLIEQAIGEYAVNVAQQIENSNHGEAGLWVEAAKQLRFPYWDWADPRVDKEGFPSLFYDDELSVLGTGKKSVTVPNPLSYFKLPYIPEDFEKLPRNGVSAWFTEWKRTYRYAEDSPNPPESNITALQSNLKKQAKDLRMKVGMLFCFPEGGNGSVIYDEFSNTRHQSRAQGDPSNLGSLEAVHNVLHGVLGGNGHMGFPEYAGFDPIFHFHHCNVDRLFALWEWCYPEYWMEKGYNIDGQDYGWTIEKGTYSDAYYQKLEDEGEFGKLVPWRHPDGNYWTSNETRHLDSKAYPKYYSYKEFLGVKVDTPAASPKEKQEARARIAKFYGIDIQAALDAIHQPSWTHIPVPGVGEVELPSNFQAIKNFRLFTVLAVLPEHAFGSSYNFQVYYNDELVGTVTVFAREDSSPCKACVLRREAGSAVRGIINIPSHIINEIIVHSGIDRSKNTPALTVGLIGKALTGKLTDVSGKVFATAQNIDGVAVPSNEAIPRSALPNEVTLLSTAVAEHVDDKNQPVYFFDWKHETGLFTSGWKAVA